ncbi:hypothetical protein GCM10010172_61360 [Paractinoplanes ferrugineus]|uniref:Acyltransferase 3 domain-containing protein n=1 Tax=Paractinoplanes ferrugineus TaxID=113564 RepID=A0A919MCB6_9ACTN|nr:acyltransferase [Actinoplanes ferrugineus]GIE14536.1 hypothetical protein Afe05nite_63760 [Actinoplanes ferrugineus]
MRNRYLDLLRAAAIVRVIVYHLFGWPWLSILLPAMGIMFALAGSLTAGSLAKRDAGQVVFARLRRLLPPLWLLGLIAVPVMLIVGWRAETDGEHPFSVTRLLFWLLPIGDPPGSDQLIDWWEPLWYLRAYLWFVVLSPVMYAAYRRFGWAAVAAPLLVMGLLDLTDRSLPDTADAALWDFVTYGACWIAGFAHHDGRLARAKPWITYPLAAIMGAAALSWLRGHQGEDPWDLNDVAESQALWSLAFVLIVLRWQPTMGWLARLRPLDRAVTLLNNRAVTVYLWHNIAIAAVWPALTLVALDDLGGRRGELADLGLALLLTALAVLLFGWAEDLAARRSPRLWPTTTHRRAPAPDPPLPDPPLPDPHLPDPHLPDPPAADPPAAELEPAALTRAGAAPAPDGPGAGPVGLGARADGPGSGPVSPGSGADGPGSGPVGLGPGAGGPVVQGGPAQLARRRP